jgi:thiol-disulfide isomerase/thioredoxin
MVLPLIAIFAVPFFLPADLKSDGAFGFPQKSATVLCDTPELRLSAACDGTYLFVQAVLWKDGDNTPGLTDDGRKIGDTACLVVDADADGKITPKLDRVYSLDAWPSLPGLTYSVELGENASTGLQGDSKGRGSIQYVEDPAAGAPAGKVRVDSFLIPLDEISRKAGDPLKIAYWGKSPKPELTLNSVAFTPANPAKSYWSFQLPRDKFHALDLKKADGLAGAFDVQNVPEGRGTIAIKASKASPKVGTSVGAADGPPEVSAQAWKNWKGEKPPTLASLKGKVVVVEFWATWCGPCVQGIPHLNELHKSHASDGLVVLSLTDQDKSAVEKFVDQKGDGMSYAVGMGSETGRDYGVSGIPHAFVIGRDGKLAWEGHPGVPEFDAAVEAALKAK